MAEIPRIPYRRPPFWGGVPADIWQQLAPSIGQLVAGATPIKAGDMLTTPNQMDLLAAGATATSLSAAKTETKAKATTNPLDVFDIRGGMKAPHVHYKGDIYMLNEAQWKRFSSLVIDGFKAKLDAAGSVSFDTVMGIADMGNRL